MTDYIRWLRGPVGPELLPRADATAVIREPAGAFCFSAAADFFPPDQLPPLAPARARLVRLAFEAQRGGP